MLLTGNALFRNDEVGLHGENMIAHGLDLLLLNLKYLIPVLLLADFNIRLRLALFVLERAVEEDDAWVFDPPAHLGVRYILVQHYSIEHPAILNLTSGNLLDTCVSFDVDLFLAASNVVGHSAHRLECQAAHQLRPARDKFCADR